MYLRPQKRVALVVSSLAVAVAAACGSGPDAAETDGGGGQGGAGGKPGTPAVPGPLELVKRIPAPGDQQSDTRLPIVMEFDAEVDESTVSDALTVQAGASPIDYQLTVDGERIIVRPTSDPTLPRSLNVSVDSSLRGRDGQEFSGDSWSFGYDLWYPARESDSAVGGALLLSLGEDTLLSAFADGSAFDIQVREGGEWNQLEAPRSAQGTLRLLDGTVHEGAVRIAWHESEGNAVYVAGLADDTWELLGEDAALTGAPAADVAFAGNDVYLAYQSAAGQLQVLEYDGQQFQDRGPAFSVPGGEAEEFALGADDQGRPVLAVVDASFDIVLARLASGSWNVLATLDREASSGPVRPRLAHRQTELLVAYEDGDEVSSHVLLARYDGALGPVGSAVDVELDGQASHPALAVDSMGRVHLAWYEAWGTDRRLLVGVFEDTDADTELRILSQEAVSGFVEEPASVFSSLDDEQAPLVAMGGESGGRAVAWNRTATLPQALPTRGERGDCAIPADSDPEFPTTLSATGCYLDIEAQELVSAAIPYNLNSPLWSDGAYKRRYLLLPQDGLVDFVGTSSLGMPTGTIVIKEFWLERTVGDPATLFPVETRFLVKRCEEGACATPWQGYSYQWNDSATNATLLETADTKAWSLSDDGSSVDHTHIYPARSDCVRCHNAEAGHLLGLNAPQLKRHQDYGDYLDIQLIAWAQLGLFGDQDPLTLSRGVERLPSPADPSHPIGDRTLAYFDSNCAHCHRPEGERPSIDLRYFGQGPVPAGNICDQLVEGSPSDSAIYQRDSVRTETQMPPLATDLTDDRQLARTSRWITQLPTSGECTP